MANEGFAGGFAAGMSPMLQRMMYAQALRNSGLTNPQTGAPYNADQGGSGVGNWISRQLGFTRSPYTQANPYVPSAANGGIAPATPGAGGNYLQGFQAVMPPPAPSGTGTTQGQPAVWHNFTPPMPPPQSPIAQQGPPAGPVPTNPGASIWGTPPVPVNAGDVGAGSLIYQPGAPGYGAFGDITSAPGRAANFQNQFGFGAPGTNQRYRKWFTERYGQPPGNNTASR